jgi:hypothetical protein
MYKVIKTDAAKLEKKLNELEPGWKVKLLQAAPEGAGCFTCVVILEKE